MATIFANAAFVSAAWHCFFCSNEPSLIVFFCKVSRGQNGLCEKTVFSLCLLILRFFTFTYTFAKHAKQGKQVGHMTPWSPMTGLDVVQISFKRRFRCRSDHVGFPRDKFTVKMQTFRELRLNKVLFSHFGLLIAVLKRECFGNPCGGRGVSPHLNASSQHIYLSLLQVVSVFKFHTFDLDVVSSFRMLSPLNGIPSKQLKPRKIGAAVRQIMNLSSAELSHFNSASIFKSQSLEVPRYEFCAI